MPASKSLVLRSPNSLPQTPPPTLRSVGQRVSRWSLPSLCATLPIGSLPPPTRFLRQRKKKNDKVKNPRGAAAVAIATTFDQEAPASPNLNRSLAFFFSRQTARELRTLRYLAFSQGASAVKVICNSS